MEEEIKVVMCRLIVWIVLVGQFHCVNISGLTQTRMAMTSLGDNDLYSVVD